MKTQNKALVFRKNSVLDLNNSELLKINGGTTPACAAAGAALAAGAVVAAAAAGAAVVGAAVGVAIAITTD